MNRKLRSKTAIVTGGARGIGFRIASFLAQNDYNIVICSRNIKEVSKAKKEIEAYRTSCIAIKADVSKYADCKKIVKKTINNFKKIDLLVNNAGIQGPVSEIWKCNQKDWEKTIAINLLGTFYMTRLVVPYMLKRKRGRILNLSGGGGAYSRPLFSAYACSKTAILRFTEILADELKGENINVFAIAPGATWTKMTKETLKKKKALANKKIIHELKILRKTGGTSEDKLNKLVSFLLGNKSKRFSGKLIHVNEINKLAKISLKYKKDSGFLRRISF